MKEWQNYEDVVRRIYARMGQERGITVECWGPRCKVRGRTDVWHQVDVLTTYSDGLHQYRTAIECKYLKAKVTKEVVMKVAAIQEDSGLSKAVIVTTIGFTADAVKTAKTKHIELVELRKPTEKDWQGRLRNVEVDISLTLPEMVNRKFSMVQPVEAAEWLQSRWNSVRFANGSVFPVKYLEEEFLEGMPPRCRKSSPPTILCVPTPTAGATCGLVSFILACSPAKPPDFATTVERGSMVERSSHLRLIELRR